MYTDTHNQQSVSSMRVASRLAHGGRIDRCLSLTSQYLPLHNAYNPQATSQDLNNSKDFVTHILCHHCMFLYLFNVNGEKVIIEET